MLLYAAVRANIVLHWNKFYDLPKASQWLGAAIKQKHSFRKQRAFIILTFAGKLNSHKHKNVTCNVKLYGLASILKLK
jgi:hypothetical protein